MTNEKAPDAGAFNHSYLAAVQLVIRSTVLEMLSPMFEAVSFMASTARVMTGLFRRALERLRDLLLLERLAEALREAALLREAAERLTVALTRLTRRLAEAFLDAVERFLLVPPVRRFADALPPRFVEAFLLPERFFFVAMCSPFDVRGKAVPL